MISKNMTKEHLCAVLSIERDSFTHPWSEGAFVSELEKDSAYCIVATIDDKVVGYAVLGIVLDEGSLLDIAVDKAYRRQGVAKALFDKMSEIAKDCKLSFITLEVRSSSAPAISLYNAMGFERVAVRKNYYSSPVEDAVLMTKFLRTGD